MGKQVSSIRFTGSVGNLTGSKGYDGKVLLREKASSVRNPQTKAQMDQRAKVKLAAKVAGMLGSVGQLALKANGFSTGRRGTLIKDLLEKIYVADDAKAALPRVLALVKNPQAISVAESISVTMDADANSISGNIAGLPDNTLSAKALLIFDRTTEQWQNVSVLDYNTQISIGVSNPDDYDVYFYAEIVMPTTAEGAAKLANLVGQAPGYTVSVNRLDASNFAYSRTLNAGRVSGVKYQDAIIATPEATIAATFGELYNSMKSAIDLGMKAAATANGVSTEQKFINANNNAISSPYGVNDITWERVQISAGDVTPVALGEANFTEPLTVSVPIDDSYSDPRFNSDDDKVFIVVYSKTNGRSVMSPGVQRIADEVTVTVPSYWQGHYVEVMAFVVSAEDNTLCSETTYCGSGRIA